MESGLCVQRFLFSLLLWKPHTPWPATTLSYNKCIGAQTCIVSYSFDVLSKECLLNLVTHHQSIAFVHVYSKEWKTKLYSKFSEVFYLLKLRFCIWENWWPMTCWGWIAHALHDITYIYTCWDATFNIVCDWNSCRLHYKSVRTESSQVWSPSLENHL